MRVVDTSAWIEWLLDSSTGQKIATSLPAREDWVVPTIVQLELAKWMMREVGEEKADAVIAFIAKRHIVGLDTGLALAAADVSSRHKLAIADSIIFATADALDADILTCDAHFKGLPRVVYVAKHGD